MFSKRPADGRQEPAAGGREEDRSQFCMGDCVLIRDEQGVEFGRGLANYDADEAVQIAGRDSRDIEALLGMPGRAAIIHRDDMVLKRD
jgi:glutamate 5-kinase